MVKGAYSVPGSPHDLVLLDTSVDQLNSSDSNVDYNMLLFNKCKNKRHQYIYIFFPRRVLKKGDLGGSLREGIKQQKQGLVIVLKCSQCEKMYRWRQRLRG